MKRMVWSVVALIAIGSTSIAQEKPVASTVDPQTIAGDVKVSKRRTQELCLNFEPEQQKSIKRLELVVSRDQGKTWEVAQTVTPDKVRFSFHTKADGLYYVSMVIVSRDGTRDPKNLTESSTILKFLIDTEAPVVRITNIQRTGKEVVVNWLTEDKFLNESATVIEYKAVSKQATEWIAVPTTAIENSKLTARFKPEVSGPIQVRVKATDYAGNRGEGTSDILDK